MDDLVEQKELEKEDRGGGEAGDTFPDAGASLFPRCAPLGVGDPGYQELHSKPGGTFSHPSNLG